MKSISAALVLLILMLLADHLGGASYYTQRLEDPKAVYVTSTGTGDSTLMLQQAINRVHETTRQGIVFVAEGHYFVTNTVYIWPGIRLIGYGSRRPLVSLPANAPGFLDAAHERIMFFFAGGRPGYGRSGQFNSETANGPVPDANPGTFYSALANIDIEIGDGNAGAVAVRAHYAQHCFLAHMEFQLGSGLAAIHEGGNVAEDIHCVGGRYAIWTSKPSPGWQFPIIDSTFENQREAAILEREAGLTLIRPQFRRVPAAVVIEPGHTDELWVKDARISEVSGPAFRFGVENNPRNEINMEGVACSDAPVFAELSESQKRVKAPSMVYEVKTFFHGLHYADLSAEPRIETRFDAKPVKNFPAQMPSDLIPLPPCESWVNMRDLGAKGDGSSDDTAVFKEAIAHHRAVYLPMGFYVVRDTLVLRPDTVLIGLHPGATQLILPDATPDYEGDGPPKALIETPKGGSNVVIGVGLYTSGNNPRAVAALWRADSNSMMNDVRFLGGHGTPKPNGSRENPYNADHSGDPDPSRRWNSQYSSLWVTDGGGGTFLDLWTPSTFAQAGMTVSRTSTEGRVYQISSEHHVRNEVRLRDASHWRFYALQTEAERGESGFALPLEVDSCEDITIANFHCYRVISSFQPFPRAVTITNARNVRFRNFHCYSNSKVSYDSAICDKSYGTELRQREFAWLDISGDQPGAKPRARSSVLARGSNVEKLAGGFFNISGGASGSDGDFYFVDAHRQQIYRWDHVTRTLSTISNAPPEPVNLAVDKSGNLLVVSYRGNGTVYTLRPGTDAAILKGEPAGARTGANFLLPVSDWHLNREALSHPISHFVAPDGSTVVPAGSAFVEGATSWGVKSSPQIRSFGLGPARPGQTFYITDESELRTWAADVGADGSLKTFRLFAEEGGEGVAIGPRGNVYIAVGDIYVYTPAGKKIETIKVPERPLQVVFGGPDGKTLFIPARTSLYAARLR